MKAHRPLGSGFDSFYRFDFFEGQRRAVIKTRLLVLLFACVVVSVAAVCGVFGVALRPWLGLAGLPISDGQLGAGIGLSVAVLLILSTAESWRAISKGGCALMRRLGARELCGKDFQDPAMRRLRDVADEMALAAGFRRPSLFVLEDPALNAFVAGYELGDAALCVTRGCLEQLHRDELQGVVAHEYSHILCGDMQTGTTLVGLVSGLGRLSSAGYWLLRGGRTRYSSRRSGGFWVIGAVAFVCGYLGVLLCSLLKAAISRQQEFRADAAAVQFTRNPLGLAGALQKVDGAHRCSYLADPSVAHAVGHLCIAPAMSRLAEGLFATHPPLGQRIAVLTRHTPGLKHAEVQPPLPTTTAASTGGQPLSGRAQKIGDTPVPLSRLESLPAQVRDALEEPEGALALWFALVLSNDPDIRARQEACLGRSGVFQDAHSLAQGAQWIAGLDGQRRLFVAELAASTLGRLEPVVFDAACQAFFEVINLDRRIGIMELLLACGMVQARGVLKPSVSKAQSLVTVRGSLHDVLSALAFVCSDTNEERDAVFLYGAGQFSKHGLALDPARQRDLPMARVFRALKDLGELRPEKKRAVLQIAQQMVGLDQTMSTKEQALMQALRWSLGCPAPDFVVPEPRRKVA